MRGHFFQGQPKTRQHLIDDYRDPVLPPLPPVKPFQLERESCSSLGSLSQANVLSDPWIIDQLHAVGYKQPNIVSNSFARIHSLKKKLILRKTEELRENHPPLPDVRREIESLLEEGYTLSHKIMLELLQRDSEMLAALKSVLSESITSRQSLKSSIEGMFIISVLRIWEDAVKKLERGKSASIMLHLALHYHNKEDPSYNWLVYELFHLALRSNVPLKGSNISEAVIRYLLGKFLVEKAKKFKEAERHLEKASQISCGYNWTTDFITGKSDHIYDNSNYLLHIVLIHRAFETSFKHPLKAVNLAKKAVAVVRRANNIFALADAYFDLAVTFNRAHMPERSIPIIDKALEIYESQGNYKNICLSLLFKSQCFRRMKDYSAVLECLNSVVNWAQTYNLSAMEAKAYKHFAEYFLGKNMYHVACRYLQKSSSLFNACDLRDELDEVTILLSYTNAWLRMNDIFHLIKKVLSPEKALLFDYVDFVELGVPVYNRLFRLKFIYKTLSLENTINALYKVEEEEVDKDNRSESDNMESSIDMSKIAGCFIPKGIEEASGVREYFAFSDFNGLIFDEELDQALNMFDKLNIDLNSDLVVKELKKVPFQHRETKKSLICLAIEEITTAQKLHCLTNGLDDLVVSMDKDRVSKKMRALRQLQGEDEGVSDNSDKLWLFTSEIHASKENSAFYDWIDKALAEAERLNYTHASSSEIYADLLDALLPLIQIYTNFDKDILTIEDKKKEKEDVGERQMGHEVAILSSQSIPPMSIAFKDGDSSSFEVQSPYVKPTKICLCKEPK